MSGYGDMPFGLSDIKVVATGSTVAIDFPVARTLKFKERVLSGELKGDDRIKAVAAIVEASEWEMEAGGMSLEGLAAMTGRTVTSGGTTPSRTASLSGAAGVAFPYFKMYGKVLGVGSDDIHCKLWKCKVTDSIEGTFSNGEFQSAAIKGIAVDDDSNGIWTFVQNETAATLPTS